MIRLEVSKKFASLRAQEGQTFVLNFTALSSTQAAAFALCSPSNPTLTFDPTLFVIGEKDNQKHNLRDMADVEWLRHPTLVHSKDGIGILCNFSQLLWFAHSACDNPQLLTIEGSLQLSELPQHKATANKVLSGASDSNVIPILANLSPDSLNTHCGLLKIEPSALKAEWLSLAAEETRATGLLEKLGIARPVQVPKPQTLNLDNRDYPVAPWRVDLSHEQQSLPFIDHALLQGEELLVCTKGTGMSPKYGYDFSAVVRINRQGRIINRLFLEDYTTITNKKRGIEGHFSASSAYCILTPVYQNCDWKGRQKLLDLKTGALIDTILPRGHTQYKIIDHVDGVFWLCRSTEAGLDYITCSSAD